MSGENCRWNEHVHEEKSRDSNGITPAVFPSFLRIRDKQEIAFIFDQYTDAAHCDILLEVAETVDVAFACT